MMNKRRFIAFAIIVLLIISGLVAVHILKKENRDDDFVFDKSSDIKLKDIETYFKHIDFKEENARDYFKDSVLNPYTIKFLMFLDGNFKEFDNEKDLFDHVYQYLHASMPPEMADQLFDLYKKFVKYQLTLGEKTKSWGLPRTTEEAIDFLHKIQDYRREVFGRDVADILFGASVKAEEYPLRRGAILADQNMYGAEKEKKLQRLNEDMWGDEADNVETYVEPYIKYKEKLAMYARDLSEMDEEGKKAKIREIREEMFSSEQIRSLEEVDQAIAAEENREKEYKIRENEIMNNSRLESAQKEDMVRELQNQMYGEEADALRRRLAIERASEPSGKR